MDGQRENSTPPKTPFCGVREMMIMVGGEGGYKELTTVYS